MNVRLAGRYQLVRELQAGGMGRVYQAVDVESGRSVAAKVMTAVEGDPLTALLRFQQEGAVLATLKHPNIVEVLGTFSEGETACIIMELLEGQSLGQILVSGPLTPARARALGRQVAAALAYAHSRGIVHRDVKPSNIMVSGSDQVKVADFGIARILRAGATLNTATGMSLGTPLYMAPEQIEGLKVDARADIYSLGAMLFQMVTGRPPFEGDDPLSIAFQHVHKSPRPPSEIDPAIPAGWDDIILTALAKQPGDRYQTADALEEALTALSGASPDEVEIAAPGEPASDSTPAADQPDAAPPPDVTAVAPPRLRPQPPATPPDDVKEPSSTTRKVPADPAATVIPPTRKRAARPPREDRKRPVQSPPVRRAESPPVSTPPVSKSPEAAPSTPPAERRPVSVPGAERQPERRRINLPVIGGLGGLVIALVVVVVVLSTRPHGSATPIPTAPSGSPVTTGTFAVKKIVTFGSYGSGKGQFNEPFGAAVDAHANVYVADYNNNRVQWFDRDGTFIGMGGTEGNGPYRFHGPIGVAVDADGDVFVADSSRSRILEFSPQAKFLHAWGTFGSGKGQFNHPEGVAVDSQGNVYVADSNNGRVQRLTPGAQQFAPWGPGSSGSTQSRLQTPTGVAVDSQGNVYVAEYDRPRVSKLSPSGALLAEYTHWGKSGSSSNVTPNGVAVDRNGIIYVADSKGNTIQVLDSAGEFVTQFGGLGAGKRELDFPVGVAVDDRGDIFIADSGNNRIVEIRTK